MIKINASTIHKTQTVYLSGPMTGLADYNRAAFNMRAEAFKALGYTVLNPAEISVTQGTDKAYTFYLKRALRMMLEADVVYVFGNWKNSKGVFVELYVARMLGMTVIFEQSGKV